MRHLIFGFVVALIATLVTWLAIVDNSSGLAEFWIALNILPMIIGSIISGSHAGPSEAVFYVLLFIQWFIVGFGLSRVFSRVFRKR